MGISSKDAENFERLNERRSKNSCIAPPSWAEEEDQTLSLEQAQKLTQQRIAAVDAECEHEIPKIRHAYEQKVERATQTYEQKVADIKKQYEYSIASIQEEYQAQVNTFAKRISDLDIQSGLLAPPWDLGLPTSF